MTDPYTLHILESAIEDFKSLDRTQAKKIKNKIEWLVANVEEIPHEALKGNLAGLFRYRFGDYRILYKLDHEARVLEVSAVGHRRNVYDE